MRDRSSRHRCPARCRPSIAARALAPSTMYCDDRGPAPKLTYLRTSALAPGCPAACCAPRSTAYSIKLGGAGKRRTSRCISRICAPVSTGLIADARIRAGRGGDDLDLLLLRGIADLQLEHEAVELRLRQRIGAFLLDRVLRGETKNGSGSSYVWPPAVTRVLLHRLEQGRLRLRRGAVDFVGEHQVGEDRPVQEVEDCARRLPWSSSRTSVPVMSLGIRSGVNCTRVNGRSSAWASVWTSSVFARPGTPIEDDVAAGEDRADEIVDDLCWPTMRRAICAMSALRARASSSSNSTSRSSPADAAGPREVVAVTTGM